MKILVGYFNVECNANIPVKANLKSFDIGFDEACIDKMEIRSLIDEARNNGIEVIGSIYANAAGNGVVEKEAFDYIEKCFISYVKKHINELDAIYYHLHGASEVIDLEGGSGDHHILKEVRRIVGPYLPIVVSCDPHGNLTKEYVEATTLIRSFRESPHTDKQQTYQRCFDELLDITANRENIRSIYRKLPLILGGEQSVSADEPVASINKYMDEMEKDPRVRSASWHVGYIRHDCACAGCGVVVVPATGNDIEYCEAKCDELYNYVWERRHQFHYTGLTAQPDKAMQMCIDFEGKIACLTDSGDNTTAGATGYNTYVLRQALAAETDKSFLFAPIHHDDSYNALANKEIGSRNHILFGEGYNELSKQIELDVEIISKGELAKFYNGVKTTVQGQSVFVKVVDKPIYIVITNCQQPVFKEIQLEHMGINWTDYNITVVKQGYIFPDFKNKCGFYVMSLTDGPTLQDTARLPFKLIMRPMYPIDNI